MKLTAFLDPKHIRQGVELSSKKRALEMLGTMVAEHFNQTAELGSDEGLCPVECFTQLCKREKLGSTGINQGVALPHAKLPACVGHSDTPVAFFLQLKQPIDYEANDNKDVDLIYALFFPENSCETHKHSLPEIAGSLSDKTLQKKLRLAENAEEIWQILAQVDRTEKE